MSVSKSKLKNIEYSATLTLLLLNIIPIILIIIGLIDFMVNLNLLNFIIFTCIVIFITLVSWFFYYKIGKEKFRIQALKSKSRFFSLVIILIIGIFIIITYVAKQYGLSICIIILFFGYLSGCLITTKKSRKYLYFSRILIALILIPTSISFGFLARGTLSSQKSSQVWNIHTIDNPGFLLPNGLDAADLNDDGYLDFLTNYEWDGKIRIAFHPGISLVKKSWPAITIGSVENAESAAFGDFDGDGNIDVVVAHGSELFSHSGVFFIWGPNSNSVMNSKAWKTSKDIIGSVDRGQYHFIKGYDINGDGISDVVVGGRGINPRAGLKWIEAPINPLQRRNISQWQIHDIDPKLESGHGFIFGDIDQDGDDDIVLCNSDWDTKNSDEKIIWYENLGIGTDAQRYPWPKHIIYQGSEFYTKEQVEIFDLTGDNYPEVLIQTMNEIYVFKNPQNLSSWELVKILKTPETCWRARPIRIGDINNDSKPDILGMLIHDSGRLPRKKASVFWMEYTGTDPISSEWETHVIKWGDDFLGIGPYNGEKWDQCLFDDVDRDGDIDIVANCEEFSTLGFVYISVVWFENPTIIKYS